MQNLVKRYSVQFNCWLVGYWQGTQFKVIRAEKV